MKPSHRPSLSCQKPQKRLGTSQEPYFNVLVGRVQVLTVQESEIRGREGGEGREHKTTEITGVLTRESGKIGKTTGLRTVRQKFSWDFLESATVFLSEVH